VGHGGHFLGAEHTMTRFRDCFYRPMLSSSMNFERWSREGALDTSARAAAICAEDPRRAYEAPPLDDAIRSGTRRVRVRRRAELGD
jgi:trimethylamine--corrinoid protein Co-methyltransferase